MFEKVEIFYQALRFSPLWLALDLLCVVHFFLAWFVTYKKEKWKIDLWYFTLTISFFIPVLAMYPFNASIYNFVSCGNTFPMIEAYIDKAFAITLIGYGSLWLGRLTFNSLRWQTPMYAFIVLFRPLNRLVEKNLKDVRALFLLVVLSLLATIFVFAVQIKEDCLFNPRAFFLKNDVLRPCFNFSISLISMAILYLSLRAIQYKSVIVKVVLFLFIGASIFFGLRGLTILSILNACIYAIFYKRGQVSFIKLFLFCTVLLFVALSMDLLRQGSSNIMMTSQKMLVALFYGNQLSDTRDFAWILSHWDESYLWGKSYLAAFISFLPRFLSSFRQDWSISIYTNQLVNFDPSLHAGLRPGLFGEAFLNFSYPGVIALGLIAGYILRYADFKLKEILQTQSDIIKAYTFTLPYLFISSLFLTANLWSFYVFVFVNLIIWFFITLKKPKAAKAPKVLLRSNR